MVLYVFLKLKNNSCTGIVNQRPSSSDTHILCTRPLLYVRKISDTLLFYPRPLDQNRQGRLGPFVPIPFLDVEGESHLLVCDTVVFHVRRCEVFPFTLNNLRGDGEDKEFRQNVYWFNTCRKKIFSTVLRLLYYTITLLYP